MGRRQRQRKRVRPRVRPSAALPVVEPAEGAPPPPASPAAASALAELARLVDQQRRLAARERDLVTALVAAGTPWPVIGSVFGVSRQAARQRFLRARDSR